MLLDIHIVDNKKIQANMILLNQKFNIYKKRTLNTLNKKNAIITKMKKNNGTLSTVIETNKQDIIDIKRKCTIERNELVSILRKKTYKNISKYDLQNQLIIELENKIAQSENKLSILAQELNKKRANVIPGLIAQLKNILTDLGMANSRFQLNFKLTDSYLSSGKNKVELFYSADKGIHFGELKKMASGGEMSRIMLALKLILSKYAKLPTLVFDEIDAGVSGEVAGKMGNILKNMSGQLQVMAITHLPQIAAKADTHFRVYKTEKEGVTTSDIVRLNKNGRLEEIAKMLSDEKITDAARQAALSLMQH